MAECATLHEEPQRHAGTPLVAIDVIPPQARTTRYHTGPVSTQQYGKPVIARHTMPSITPAAVVSDVREERLPITEEMRESQTHWHVCRFETDGLEVRRIEIPDISKDEVAQAVHDLNRTTHPVLQKLKALEPEFFDQISAVHKDCEHEFGPHFRTDLMQLEDLVVEKERYSKERGRGYERDQRGSRHHHRSRHSERRSKSRGLPPSRSRERKLKRTGVTAYYRTSPRSDADLHVLVYGRVEEALPRTPPRFIYRDEVAEEAHVRFQQAPQGLPHHPHQQAQQPPQPHMGHPQHQPQHPPYPPPGDRQFNQTPQPPPQVPRNAAPQAGGNPINRGEIPAGQGRPQMQPQGYPPGHPQGHSQVHQQGKPQGEQQVQHRPPPQGQAQHMPTALHQAPPPVQKRPFQRQTEYRGNGPVVTIVQPPHKSGILKQPAGQGVPQRRESFIPQFASPPGSPGTDESLVSEIFTEEDYDSDTAVSMESLPEDRQFAALRKPANVVVNNIAPPHPLRFAEPAAHHGIQSKQPRNQAPLQPMQQQQGQRHVVKERQHPIGNHMMTDRVFAPTPPPILPNIQRPRVDVREIRQNAYEAGRADAREEAIIKLAERVAVAAVSSSAKPQIIIPERRHESPVPQQPVRRTTLPLLPPHSGVRRVSGMDARRNSFAQPPLPERYESDRPVDRRRSSLVERDFERRRDGDADYVVEYGAGSYDSDVFDEEEVYEERQRGSGVFRRSSSPHPYSPKAEGRFRRPSVTDDRDRQYETVRVRVDGERLPRREEDSVYVRDRVEKGDFGRRHERRDSSVEGVRFENCNPFTPRPGLPKRTATYPARYGREH